MSSEEPIHEKHDVLYHYTTVGGLKGILENQCLWATHYSHLNDTTEIGHFRGELKKRLRPQFKKEIRARYRSNSRIKRKIQKRGGLKNVTDTTVDEFVDRFFNVTFTPRKRGITICEPFITSFCSHISDDEYERENGLLSQWRSYGGGGYAIVFGTLELSNLRLRESDEFDYSPLYIGDVVYEGDEEAFHEEFSEFISQLEAKFHDEIMGNNDPPDDLLEEVVKSFTRYKHRGFREEREVRIVASPLTHELREAAYEQMPDSAPGSLLPLKEIKTRGTGNDKIRYIELLNFSENHPGLPIRRIIVGPGNDQEIREKKAHGWTRGMGIEITLSETPYIERKSQPAASRPLTG